MDEVWLCLLLLRAVYYMDVATHADGMDPHAARRDVHLRLLRVEEGEVAVVERRRGPREVHHELGRRSRVRPRGRLFHQPLPFPELRHTVFFAGEEPPHGRLPLRVEGELRPAHPRDAAHHAAHAAHHARDKHQELCGVAPLGLSPTEGPAR